MLPAEGARVRTLTSARSAVLARLLPQQPLRFRATVRRSLGTRTPQSASPVRTPVSDASVLPRTSASSATRTLEPLQTAPADVIKGTSPTSPPEDANYAT